MDEIKNNIKKDIAIKLKKLREENKLSFAEVAAKAEISEKWLRKAECARGNLDWYFLFKIVKAFNKDLTIHFKDKI
ncbi:MAG: helix-turn-helix transcriptional regulator [Alphaproteobacteria bacterium]